MRAKPGQALPPGSSSPPSHGCPSCARLLARLQETASDAAAEAQTLAEERVCCLRFPALWRSAAGPLRAGPLRAGPPEPLLQPGELAAGGCQPAAAPAGSAASATDSRVPFGRSFLAGRSGLQPRRGRGISLPPRRSGSGRARGETEWAPWSDRGLGAGASSQRPQPGLGSGRLEPLAPEENTVPELGACPGFVHGEKPTMALQPRVHLWTSWDTFWLHRRMDACSMCMFHTTPEIFTAGLF